jgi:hypothetical protein
VTATKLRCILICLIIVLLGGFTAGAWWVQGILAEKVQETDHAKTDADISSTELQQLKQLKKQVADEQDVVDRAKQIAATSAQYQYQDQVIKDVSDYAARYSIQVSTFDFSSASKPGANSTGPNGAKKTSFTVTLKGPVAFVTFMKFLRDLEDNLTKIQVTSLTLAPDKDPTNITNPTISCEVYLKS